ncbi:SRR1-like protein [Cloeon dipterum]|uniref:SRR1-like protein n=1 Tax=Cloeon dipterum TaxID=197152 RepID=UPI0032203102
MNNGDDGFTLVTRKTRSQKKVRLPLASNSSDKKNLVIAEVSRDLAIKQVQKSRSEIEASEFFKQALCSLQEGLESIKNGSVKHFLCYGLGCFSSCPIARHQLGFLLALKGHLAPLSVLLYDPLFTPLERSLLIDEFGLSLIDTNEEGKRSVSKEGCTLVFAPHCPKQLTNNLLWANWHPELLGRCLLLANSFNSVANNPASQPETAEYLLRIHEHTCEVGLKNSFRLYDVFNDLAFHSFDTEKISQDFWVNHPEPIYPEDDTGQVIRNGQQS